MENPYQSPRAAPEESGLYEPTVIDALCAIVLLLFWWPLLFSVVYLIEGCSVRGFLFFCLQVPYLVGLYVAVYMFT